MNWFTTLGYIVVQGPVPAWQTFAPEVLGARAEPHNSGDLRVRLDDLAYRILVQDGDALGGASLISLGFTVDSMDTLAALANHLRENGVDVRQDNELRKRRGVEGLLTFLDPDGTSIEAVYGLPVADSAFDSAQDVAFVTGELGAGHVFLVGGIEPSELAGWYRDILGFKLTDTIALAALGSDDDAYFLHCNPRHHSVAIARSPVLSRGLAHIMLEVTDFRTLGRMMTVAQNAQADITLTLGEHPNDQVTSFYVTTPSGFDIEYGCDGLLVDDATWEPRHYEHLSTWGHSYVGPSQ